MRSLAVSDEAASFPSLLDKANERFKEYSQYAPAALGLPLVLVAANVLLTTFGCSTSFRNACCTCRGMIFLSNFFGVFSLLLLGIFCAAEMGFAIFFSDFCIDPNSGMIKLADYSGTGFQLNITEYYTVCEGENPMGALLGSATDALESFKGQLEATQADPSCAASGAYDGLIDSIDSSAASVQEVVAAVSCAELNPYVQRNEREEVGASEAAHHAKKVFFRGRGRERRSVFLPWD
jgi:hypothetical protein